jgi:hypothetical protein
VRAFLPGSSLVQLVAIGAALTTLVPIIFGVPKFGFVESD